MNGPLTGNAIGRLTAGNASYAEQLAGAADSATSDAGPAHTPFAAVLACSDARVPPERVPEQSSNDLFVV